MGGDGHVSGLDGGDGFTDSTYPQAQVTYIKYVQLFACQTCLNKAG